MIKILELLTINLCFCAEACSLFNMMSKFWLDTFFYSFDCFDCLKGTNFS